MKIEYAIVGDGFAAMFLAHRMIAAGKDFRVFSKGLKGASHISAGVANPVVLKRFNTFWLAKEQLEELRGVMEEIEEYTGRNYLIEEQISRIFHDENERKLWLKKAQDDNLKDFLATDFEEAGSVVNPFGCGRVNHSCRIDVGGFFSGMSGYLSERNLLKDEFDYTEFKAVTGNYRENVFEKIIFAEGIGVRENPFFRNLPIHPNKGHNFDLQLSTDTEKHIFKKKHFLFRKSDGGYYYGGTYDRFGNGSQTDEKAVEELRKGLEEFYPEEYTVASVNTAYRPTVADRRPILGQHIDHPNLFVFNGLGARGVLNACYFSQHLFDLVDNGEELPMEIDLKRFQG